MSENRRADDPRIAKLVDDMSSVKAELARNTEITGQVADILASFRVVGAVAKWTAAVVAAVAAIWHAINGGGK